MTIVLPRARVHVRQLVPGTTRYRAVDALLLGALAVISLVAVVFSRRVDGWGLLVLKNLGAAAVYLVLIITGDRHRGTHKGFAFRLAAVMLAFLYINVAVDKLQLVLYGRWLDDTVLTLEHAVFGVQPTLWLQQFISRPLTEWMMFAYVIYLPMFLGLCGIVYHRSGEAAAEYCFFVLGLSNVACDLSFMLFPVAGPMAHICSQYAVPLDGYVWTWMGELIRTRAQFVGGNIPSPHCANAMVMLLLAWRYHRPSFRILLPIVLSVLLATVYCRFHYVTDAVLGVLVALVAFRAAPALMKVWNRLVRT